MKWRFTEEQRHLLAEKFMDWGNLVFTGLIIAQFASGGRLVNLWLGLIGVIIVYFIGIYVAKGGD